MKVHNLYNHVIQYFILISLLILPIKWKWEGKAQFIWDYLRIWCSSSVCKVFAYFPTLLPRECSQNLNHHFPPLQYQILSSNFGAENMNIWFFLNQNSHIVHNANCQLQNNLAINVDTISSKFKVLFCIRIWSRISISDRHGQSTLWGIGIRKQGEKFLVWL